ncbi:putative signal transducing protein [Flavobacterium aquicola]|uniref:Putative signal transducing protein n=1 Tax=Flavobacterium aquicola TaxID=1682742 RepID=A0A3E0ESG3_9FLAO|nr:DUF2007 domain-containing protein [Flavobacterium aquicola]REH00097.1 putative signal transducing protein [Flavobacterium aquicola]
MIILFRGSQMEVMNIKNLLSNAGIESFVQNQYMSAIEPWLVTAGGYNPVNLQINEADFAAAKEIIDKYNKGDYNIE